MVDAGVVMPVGDSITRGAQVFDIGEPMGYRDHLQDILGIKNFEFVGAFKQPEASQTYGVRHSGVAGNKTFDVESRILTELQANMPLGYPGRRIVLLMIGTNDPRSTLSQRQTAAQNILDIINIIDRYDPKIEIFVCDIIPAGVSSNNALIVLVNNEFRSIIQTRQQTKPNLHRIDMYGSFLNDSTGLCSGNYSANCMGDGTHPNDLGYLAIAIQFSFCINNPTLEYCY